MRALITTLLLLSSATFAAESASPAAANPLAGLGRSSTEQAQLDEVAINRAGANGK